MRSGHPPERLQVELPSLVGPALSQRGYRVVGQGVTGITWRREMSGKLILGIAALGLLAVGGLASGEPASIILGALCAVGGAALLIARRPASVTIVFHRIPGGTELTVSGGRDAARAAEIARQVMVSSSPPAPTPRAADSPQSRWIPPGR